MRTTIIQYRKDPLFTCLSYFQGRPHNINNINAASLWTQFFFSGVKSLFAVHFVGLTFVDLVDIGGQSACQNGLLTKVTLCTLWRTGAKAILLQHRWIFCCVDTVAQSHISRQRLHEAYKTVFAIFHPQTSIYDYIHPKEIYAKVNTRAVASGHGCQC